MDLDKHKIWLILSIVIAILIVGFVFIYPNVKKGFAGEAVSAGSAICTESASEGTTVGVLTGTALSICAQAAKAGSINQISSAVAKKLCLSVYRGVPIVKNTDQNSLRYGYRQFTVLATNEDWQTKCPDYINSNTGSTGVPSDWIILGTGATSFAPLTEIEARNCIDSGTTNFNLFNPACPAVAECSPDCAGKTCGSDGCGGSCGSCSAGQSCDHGLCLFPPETCNDSNDNDGDTFIDCADPDCLTDAFCMTKCTTNTDCPVICNGYTEKVQVCDQGQCKFEGSFLTGSLNCGYGEDCTNTIDDNQNMEIDCEDITCQGNIACKDKYCKCQADEDCVIIQNSWSCVDCENDAGCNAGEKCESNTCVQATLTLLGDTGNDGQVCMPELMSSIGSWKSGQLTMPDLMTIIGNWKKSGC